MLIIGSQAMKHWGLLEEGVEPRDTDIICTFEEFQKECARIKIEEGITRCVPLSDKKFHVRNKAGWNYEFEIAWPGSSGEGLLMAFEGYATPEVLLSLKLSHRYLRNSPHFLKTMRTIQLLRDYGVRLSVGLEKWLPKREAETYTYAHPKLDVSKDTFFTDEVGYVFDHDTIHLTQALLGDRPSSGPRTMTPAYTHYMVDGAQVMTSKEKFFAVHDNVRLAGVYEETCVLALERSQIPHNMNRDENGVLSLHGNGPTARWSFEYALMKVCTSITSGWFREYAWENYDKVLDLYEKMGEDNYIQRLLANQHLLKPFKEGMQ